MTEGWEQHGSTGARPDGLELEGARDLVEAEQWADALKALGPFRRSRPDDPSVWELQARALQGAGELTEAQFAADRWVGLCPGSAPPLRLLADLLAQRGKSYPAAEAAEKLVLLDPGDVDAHRRLATYCRAAGLVPRARIAVTRALEIDPLDAESYELAGVIELAGSQPGAAVDHFRQSLRLDPGNGRVAVLLQRALEAQQTKAAGARHATRRTRADARARTRTVRARDRDQAKAASRADRALGRAMRSSGGRRDRMVGAVILVLIVGLALAVRL